MKHLTILLVSCVVLIFSCQKDDLGDPTLNTPPSSSELWGDNVTTSAYGRVVDVNDNPVQGAVVKAGLVSTTTDANGVFRLNGIAAYKQLGYIKVEKTGYFLGSRSFVPMIGGNRINIRMLSNAPVGNFNASTGGTVSAQGVEVTLAPGSITKNNAPYTGTVWVSLRHINPLSDNFSEEMPGNLIGVQNNQSRALISYGMIAAELTDDNGQSLQIANGQTATVKFPIPTQQLSTAPATIDLWSFDEQKGYWKHEGTASRQGNEYISQVSHFSFWNCDVPGEWIMLHGQLINSANQQPLQGAKVTLNSQNYGSASDYTNLFGLFGGWVPAGQPMNMTVHFTCGGATLTVLNQNIGPFSSNTNLNAITVNLPGATQTTGTLVDCNNANISSGYLLADGQIYFANGSGQFNISACGSIVMVYPFSTNPHVSGQSQTINLSGGTQDIGNMQICNGGGTGTVTDIDGNTYATVLIGSQEWMQENLKTTRYRNGDLIPTGLTVTQWENTNSGAFAIYSDSIQYNNIYGKLYNWYAVTDPRGLCPAGWHVPSDNEWNQLVEFLDPQANTTVVGPQSQTAGGLMKSVGDLESGTGLWYSPNTGAINSSGFSGLPNGYRLYDGYFYGCGHIGNWWSSSPTNTNYAKFRQLLYTNGKVTRADYNVRSGISVRCLKD